MDKLRTAIPNLFYDLIAKFCPGILLSICILMDSRLKFLEFDQIPSTILVILFLVGSYVMGFLLNIFSESTALIINLSIYHVISRLTKQDLWVLDSWEVMLKYGYNEESIYILNIRKHLAELGLFRALFVAWLFLWIFQISFISSIGYSQKFLILMVLGFACFHRDFGLRRVTQRFLDSKQDNRENYVIGKTR